MKTDQKSIIGAEDEFNPAIAAYLAEKITFIMLLSVSIFVHLPERFRTVSPAISAALRLWFSFLFFQSFSLAG
jgi:hypothetical protein